MKRLLSICIPVYKNAESLEILVKQIQHVTSEFSSELNIEIVFVDDGSTDNSWEILLKLREKYPNEISIYKLSRNFGQLSAMLATFQFAKGDALISMSADLQDPTELIKQMIEAWDAGSDVVIGFRESRNDGRLFKISSKLAYAYARKSTPGLPSGGFDYFLMSRRVADSLISLRGRFRFIQGDLLWMGFRVSYLPYTRQIRAHGKSGYTWSKRLRNFIDLVIDSSYGPIQMMSRIGIFAALVGIAYLFTVVYSWSRGGTPFTGWAPIMVTLLILNGIVMTMLGIIGEYLWRIHDEIRQRPLFVLDESKPKN